MQDKELKIFLGFIAFFLAAVIVSGCKGLSVQSNIAKAQTTTGNIVKHADGIDGEVKTIKGNEPQKKAIVKHTAGIREDAAAVLNSLADAITGDQKKEKELAAYKENPLVWLAMFIWKWGKFFLFAAIGFASLYPLSFILGLFSPATAAFRISQGLVRALPVANPIRWAHDVLGRRTVSVPAKVVVDLNGDGLTNADDLALATTDEQRAEIQRIILR